ncbi:MAG TPA: class I SAM-dependent methyltransferase, partial [Candidatus Aquilonibacter sp.]
RITTIAQDVSGEASRNCPWVDEYHVGSLETLPDSGPFDLISLTHVIEHLPDPMATLLYAAKRLAPGGRLFVTGPYRPAGDARAPLARWETYSYLHVPAHLTYLSERWFRRLAGESGLELESWDASHEGGDAFEAILRSKLPTDYTK